jgi:endonuclease/exonuclease/phosphatase family metal-dependent hydrolase
LIRVGTLNLRREFDRWPERLPLVAAEIAREQPHLLGLQEVGVARRQGAQIAAAVNQALGRPAYSFYLQRKPHWRYQFIEGLGILARVPVDGHRRLTLSWRGWLAQRVRLTLAGRPLDFVNVHLPPRPDNRAKRLAFVERILAWLSDCDCALLAGDFNDLPDSPPLRAVQSQMRSAHAEAHGREPDWTWPTPLLPWYGQFSAVLDYVLVRGPLRVAAARLAFDRPHQADPRLWPSDHLGLIVDLE